MLTIRTAQFPPLTRPLRHAALVRQALGAHAARAAALGPAALDDLAEVVLQRCVEHRIEDPADQRRVMDLAMVFGVDWQQPGLAWIAQGLADPQLADPTLRVRRLWRRALRHLARGA